MRAHHILPLLALSVSACSATTFDRFYICKATSWPEVWMSGEPGADPAAPDRAWEGLLAGMASDPRTLSLLSRLHGGLPLSLEVLQGVAPPESRSFAAEAAMTKAPSEGIRVAIRVSDVGAVAAESVNDLLICRRRTAFAWTSRDVEHGDVTPPPGASLFFFADGSLAAFELAVMDYMNRHAPGWTALVSGTSTRTTEELPSANRAALAKRVGDHAERHAAYWRPR